MKNYFIISLLAIMLLQTFSKVVVLVDYQANKEYIMEFLCINRDRPELKCEGKCQLTKKLKAQHDTDKQANERGQKQEVQVNLYCQSLFSLFLNPANYSFLSISLLVGPYGSYLPQHFSPTTVYSLNNWRMRCHCVF